MATLSQLRSEPVWVAQRVTPAMDGFLIQPLRRHFGLGPALIGAPGDEFHLNGRHRSVNWIRHSRWCNDRRYAASDSRDLRGDLDAYRAVDVGITGPRLFDACRRLDRVVRAGKLPGLAEWFGTYDGHHVVGWYQGRPGTSDESHLRHLHVGVWTAYADDANTMRVVYAATTGDGFADLPDTDVPGEEEDMDPQLEHDLTWRLLGIARGDDPIVIPARPGGAPEARIPNGTVQRLARVEAAVAALAAADTTRDAGLLAAIQALTAGGTSVDTAAVVAAVRQEAAQSRTVVESLQREIDDLRGALAAAEHAAATALDIPPTG